MTSPQLPPDSPLERPAAANKIRRALLGGVGTLAALTGLGFAAWRSGAVPKPAPALGDPPPPGFWQMQWPTPQDGNLLMASLQGKPLLLNFWATWCPPCVEELPLLEDFYLKNKANGWQVLGIAVDKLQPVQAFLRKQPLSFPVGMAGFAGTELTRSMGNLAGSLPFTVVLGADGSILHRKMGRVSPQELSVWTGLK